MDAQTARWILYITTAVGAVVWFAGLRFLRASFYTPIHRDEEPGERFELVERASIGGIRGHVEVEGTPADLAARAAAILAEKASDAVGPVKIVEAGDDRVAFVGAADAAGPQSAGRFLRGGELHFRPRGSGHTRIDYEIQMAAGRGLLMGGMVFQMLGLLALVGGFFAMNAWVVDHPSPSVRGQVLQMAQVVHFLWPPFLFGGLYRQGRKSIRGAFEVMIHNLPYYGDR
jgi:hypothetical protein